MELSAKPRLQLCCITSPIVTKEGLLRCWCSFCEKSICDSCAMRYTVKDYYHHKECKKLCPHDEKYHAASDDDFIPRERKEFV
jgi:hypothetical protein